MAYIRVPPNKYESFSDGYRVIIFDQFNKERARFRVDSKSLPMVKKL